MRNLFLAVSIGALLVSCARDYWGSGMYLFENGSVEEVTVITYTPHESTAFDTALSILPNAIDTIHDIAEVGCNFTPAHLGWLRVYDSEWRLLYEQNPIDENLWAVERQYKKGSYGHTVNTFVFTDDMVRR